MGRTIMRTLVPFHCGGDALAMSDRPGGEPWLGCGRGADEDKEQESAHGRSNPLNLHFMWRGSTEWAVFVRCRSAVLEARHTSTLL